MEKRRIIKSIQMMGMRITVNDLVIIADKEFLVIYSQNNDGVQVPICITLNLDNYCDLDRDKFKVKIISNSIEDNFI